VLIFLLAGTCRFNNSKVDNWGSSSSVGIWAGGQEKTPKHRMKREESPKEPGSALALIAENTTNVSEDKTGLLIVSTGSLGFTSFSQAVGHSRRARKRPCYSPPPLRQGAGESDYRRENQVDDSQSMSRDQRPIIA
jgi:hypothetical protein